MSYRGQGEYGNPVRDVVGYGANPPNPRWPNNAKVALQIWLLSEIVGAKPYPGQRHINIETLYNYGSRAGFWRIFRILKERNLRATVYAVGMALERNPAAGRAMVDADWEVASHGYRWIDYQNVDQKTEREHIRKTVEIHHRVLGQRVLGLVCKPNKNTRKLCVEEGGFLYDSDAYDDDLPYWNTEYGRPHLVIPYTLSENDMKFVSPGGFNNGSDFFGYLKDNLDFLIAEGRSGRPVMMTVGLHGRVVGRPGRAAALAKFLDYAMSFDKDVWICRRDEIARHWYRYHWPEGYGKAPPYATGVFSKL
eukprot:GSMAST32.ASY1.ANO1.815.1 assembled CDS